MQRIIDAVTGGLSGGCGSALDACRLFHGRGQCYEGLGFINVDWFDPVLLVTLYQEPNKADWKALIDGLRPLEAVTACLLVQRRYLRGGPINAIWGEQPEKTLAREQGLLFELSFGGKQNIGYFMDMAPGRQWLRQRVVGKRVLNLFSYTCAFSVAAIADGAESVLNLDMSRAALDQGRENHRLNHQGEALKRKVNFMAYDLFRSWKRVIQRGPYDIVIIDPPSRQKGSFLADKDYARVVRRLPELMPQGGDILACLNAPEKGDDFLVSIFADQCPEASALGRVDNRTDFPELDRKKSLKMLHFQLDAASPQ